MVFGQVSDSTKTANAHFLKGNELNESQNYEQAIVEYLKAVSILEEQKDSAKLVPLYTNIGALNARIQNLDMAVFYFEKSLRCNKSNENLRLAVLSNIASLYNDKKDRKSSLKKSAEAEVLAKKLNNGAILSNIYSNYCNIYRDLGDYEKSITYGIKSLDLKHKLQINPDISINNVGYSLLLDKQYDKAISYLKEIEFTTNKTLQAIVFNNLKNAYQAKGNDKKALLYADDHLQLKDSLTNEQQKLKVATLIEKYESEKKQQQIDVLHIENQIQQVKLENQRVLFLILAIMALLAFVLIYQWFRNNKIKQRLQQSSLQNKLLRTQLNPHFLFHSLNSIQSFIHENKKEESSSYLVSYSKLMRAILESSDLDFITVEDDLNAIKEYIKLQRLNLDEDVEITVAGSDKIAECKIPPMFVQPYVENALIHGVNGLKNGKVSVEYKEKKSKIQVLISDNGKGLESRKSNNELYRSMSTDIIDQRIQNLKQMHQYDIHISTKSDKNGTRILLEFPKKYKLL